MLDTKARKGLPKVSMYFFNQGQESYKREVSSGEVDIEEELKPGHCVEPERETQVCATEVVVSDTRNTRSVNGFMVINRFLWPLSARIPTSPPPADTPIPLGSSTFIQSMAAAVSQLGKRCIKGRIWVQGGEGR